MDRIEKYAGESKGQKGDLKLGARRFDVPTLRDHERNLRKKHKKNASAVDKFLLEKFEDHIGVEHRSVDELRRENDWLKSQLPNSKGASNFTATMKQDAAS